MFKKNDSPISLFSFQDIITSLIGIMLLILLIMCIQLLTKVETKQTEGSKKEELEQLKQKKQEARRRRDIVIKQMQAAHHATSHAYMTPYELDMKIRDLKKKIENAKQEKKKQTEKQEKLEEQYQTVEVKKEKQEKNSDTKEQKKQVQQLKENIRELEKEVSKLKQKIANQKIIEITVEEDSGLKPLIIIVSGKKIIVKEQAKKEIFWQLNNDQISENHISKLMDKLSAYKEKKYHFVFLIKPSAAKLATVLELLFKKTYSSEEYGIEPIYEDEEVE